MPKAAPVAIPDVLNQEKHSAVNPLTSEFCRYIEAELHAILKSPFFRSSRRSCEFLQHVVEAVLEGRADSLKERMIGIEVLGREASYDTGSDAAVRVRANDIRKRLGSYYEQNQPIALRIELPPGSYVPQFVKAAPIAVPAMPPNTRVNPIPALDLRYLAGPTVLALFICAIAIRYQLLGATPFHLFWNELLREKTSLTIVVNPSEEIDRIQAGIPLLMLAQAFHVEPAIRKSGEPSEHEHTVRGSVLIRLSNDLPLQTERYRDARFVLQTTRDGEQIVDRQTPAHTWTHASLITMLPGTVPVISIGATDMDALRSGVRLLTDRSSFPQLLLNSLKAAGLTQALFDEQGLWIDPALQARK